MNEAEFLQACRDIRVLGWVWFGLMIAAGSLAFSYAAIYQFGVRLRLPRLKATIKRLAADRANLRDKVFHLQARLETVGLEAQKELARVDGIRRKTEARLVEQNDILASMQGLILAVNTPHVEPGSPDSWIAQRLDGS